MTAKSLSTGFSIDTLLVLVLAPSLILNQDAFTVVVAALAYILLSIWLPLPLWRRDITASARNRISFVTRYGMLLVIASGAVIVPTITNVVRRSIAQVDPMGIPAADVTISDSAIQTEIALRYLRDGKNPYRENYVGTLLESYQWQEIDDSDWKDPVFEHFAYLPANLFISIPISELFGVLGLLYDQRVIFLILFTILLLVLPYLEEKTAYSLGIVAAVGLNPLLVEAVYLGMNDVAVLLAIIIMLMMLIRNKIFWSALFLGIACALKQYAWFVAPFYFLYLLKINANRNLKHYLVLPLVIVLAVLVLTIIPFMIWDAEAFYSDTFAYPAGRTANLYPIRGFTIGRILMSFGVIRSFVSPFPFHWLQALLGIPLLYLLSRQLYKNGLWFLPIAAGTMIFGIGFVSRFFHQNYLGVSIALIAVGLLMKLSAQNDPSDRPRQSTFIGKSHSL